MKEIHNLLERFLGLILPCHILECNSCLLLDITSGAALAYAHDPASAFVHASHEKHQHQKHDYCGKKDAYHHGNKFTHRVGLFVMESNTFSFQTLRQGVHTFHLVHTVSHILVKGFLDLRLYCQHAGLKRYFLHLILIYHLNKFVISDLAGVTAHHICHEAETHQRNKETNQKSQNGLAVSVRSLVFRVISVRTVSVVPIVHMIIHSFPPVVIFFIIKRFL